MGAGSGARHHAVVELAHLVGTSLEAKAIIGGGLRCQVAEAPQDLVHPPGPLGPERTGVFGAD